MLCVSIHRSQSVNAIHFHNSSFTSTSPSSPSQTSPSPKPTWPSSLQCHLLWSRWTWNADLPPIPPLSKIAGPWDALQPVAEAWQQPSHRLLRALQVCLFVCDVIMQLIEQNKIGGCLAHDCRHYYYRRDHLLSTALQSGFICPAHDCSFPPCMATYACLNDEAHVLAALPRITVNCSLQLACCLHDPS